MYFSKPFRVCDIANGEGIRVTLFCSGCSHHCKGCFNEEAWDYQYGEPFLPEDLNELLDACDKPEIAGLSLLGGEPMDPRNQWTILAICHAFRDRFGDKKNIWMWTGYTLDDILSESHTEVHLPLCTYEIIRLVDVVVDGPFIEEQKDISLKFRGSKNQRIIRLDPNSINIRSIE